MYSKLKGLSVRAALVTALAVLILAVCAFFAGGRAVLTILRGPESLADLDLNDLDGRYVTMDVGTTLIDYAYTEDDKGSLISTEYMVFTPDESCIGVLVRKGDMSKYGPLFDVQIDSESWEPDPATTFTVTGTIHPMDSESKRFFNDVMDYLDWDHSWAVYSILHVNEVNGTPTGLAWLLAAVCVILVVWALLLIILAASGFFQKHIRRFIKESDNPERTEEELENWFPEAQRFGKAFFGPRYIIFQSGTGQRIIRAEDLAWVYQQTQRTNGIATNHSLMMGTMDKKIRACAMRKKLIAQAMGYIDQNYPWVVIGYDGQIRKAFNADPRSLEEFAQAQHTPATEAEAAGM